MAMMISQYTDGEVLTYATFWILKKTILMCGHCLNRIYCSTRMILKATIQSSQNQQRTNKELWTENDEGNPIDYYCAFDASDEAKYVMERIKQFCTEFGYSYNDIAILYRINAQSRIFEEFLIKYDIPYTIVGGLRFYERKEIKDMLSYLRVILNPYDSVSLNRIINVPRRGIGNTTLENYTCMLMPKEFHCLMPLSTVMKYRMFPVLLPGQ